jgi:hypothetical protein
MSSVISFDRLLMGVAVASSLGIVYAIGGQPRMPATIGLLHKARADLAATMPGRGGHRERALALVDQAIAEVHEGIALAAAR